MQVMSKNITSRRRSLYFTSPGLEGAIWLAVTDFTRRAGVAGASGAFGAARRGLMAGTGSERGGLFQFLEREDLDVLLLAVFGDIEVARLQALDGIAALVLHRDVDHDQLGRGSELGDALGRRRRGACVACCVCGGCAETTSSPLKSVAIMARIFEVFPGSCVAPRT